MKAPFLGKRCIPQLEAFDTGSVELYRGRGGKPVPEAIAFGTSMTSHRASASSRIAPTAARIPASRTPEPWASLATM